MAALVLVAALGVTAAQPGFEPTSSYAVQTITGWRVYVHNQLLNEKKKLGAETLDLLRAKLCVVARTVPKRALAKLRQVAIWVECNPRVACACYHPSRKWLEGHGFNPEKARSIEIGGPRNFLNWSGHQPSMVLHELAHAYHHQVLGYGHGEVKAAFTRAVESKRYESVLNYNGKKVRHYALNNDQEYFAEMTEAYFGTNDFYPFVRAELKEHDPEMHTLLRKLWNQ